MPIVEPISDCVWHAPLTTLRLRDASRTNALHHADAKPAVQPVGLDDPDVAAALGLRGRRRRRQLLALVAELQPRGHDVRLGYKRQPLAERRRVARHVLREPRLGAQLAVRGQLAGEPPATIFGGEVCTASTGWAAQCRLVQRRSFVAVLGKAFLRLARVAGAAAACNR
jgi:hypothetical protein